jgi:hypothetical protein
MNIFKANVLLYQPNYINHHHLADINPRLNSEFLNFSNIYLGIEVLNYVDKLDEAEKNDFYIRCREFLIVSCLEIQKRFDFRDALLSQISIFGPKSENRPNSIFNIAKNLNRIINKDHMQKIDDQWRLYIQSYSELPTEIKDEKNIDEYWFKIYKLTDMAGNFKFTELGNFVLCRFNGNAICHIQMPHAKECFQK